MKIALKPPSPAAVENFWRAQQSAPYSYTPPGMTQGPPLPGWTVDHNRVRLGEGEAVFAAAVDALRRWAMLPAGWTRIIPADAPLLPGITLGVLIHGYGLYFLNVARIVYTIDETGSSVRRFGFAYGTLPRHAEQGEERFLIEMEKDGPVWYDLLAYSRPAHWLSRLGYPLARRLQRRFARESLAAMQGAVRETVSTAFQPP